MQAASRRLLERLGDPSPRFYHRREDETADIATSIKSHLYRVLRARRGQCEACPEFGLPAASEYSHSYSGTLQVFRDAIGESLERYEPRLRNARVTKAEQIEDAMMMRFVVRGELQAPRERVFMEVTISIRANGSVTLSD